MKLLCLSDSLVTLFEVFPKEEKQKEEKTCVSGQAVVDLLPLLHGETSTFALSIHTCEVRNSQYPINADMKITTESLG